ncbi:MAG: diaminopimelate epimerase [SAR202 cluster bacterium]|mgnify:FL=1|jgi:diaminopimelate epimerase|nr:diaminopimelate epimerase [SAR202 cluster bacterium]HJO59456.1 diaminopimelate epimerase [SAR202 cluster bacterium]|tara:strand:+ start:507 stop:1346 length:840 start_codon:yes stop_codon:yes gene_type:complete
MKFTKMHGAGNDYVYVNGFEYDLDWKHISQTVSDRHKGIGADGLIVACPSSNNSDLKMRMFNADGSEGEMCGNGIRCLVGFARDESLINGDLQVITVETMAGNLDVFPILEDSRMIGAKVSMGSPNLVPKNVPVQIGSDEPTLDYSLDVDTHELSLGFVSMGNPHAIAFIEEDVDNFPLELIGPKIENHDIFPNKVNFEIVNALSPSELKVRVWERGSGITMACGSGACAVAVAARLKGITLDDVNLKLPGGDLKVRWDGVGEVELEGPIETVYKGVLQ